MQQDERSNVVQDTVDHPAKEGWFELAHLRLTNDGAESKAIKEQISERYDAPIGSELFNTIVSDLDMGMQHYAAIRATHELTNRGSLGLSARGMESYLSSVGPDWDAPRFIDTFRSATAYGLIGRITLEIGGVCQWGDWECTKLLDDQIKSMPSEVSKGDFGYVHPWFNRGNPTTYYYRHIEDNDEIDAPMRLGIVTRRRALLDVGQDEKDPYLVKFFKESSALMLLEQLDPEDKKVLLDYPLHKIKAFRHKAHGLAGYIFQEGISEAKGRTRVVLPLGTQVLAQMGSNKD